MNNILKGQAYIEQFALMDELQTHEFSQWLMAMANYLDDGTNLYPSDFIEIKTLNDWIDEIKVLP